MQRLLIISALFCSVSIQAVGCSVHRLATRVSPQVKSLFTENRNMHTGQTREEAGKRINDLQKQVRFLSTAMAIVSVGYAVQAYNAHKFRKLQLELNDVLVKSLQAQGDVLVNLHDTIPSVTRQLDEAVENDSRGLMGPPDGPTSRWADR